jgi:hypothetical protein
MVKKRKDANWFNSPTQQLAAINVQPVTGGFMGREAMWLFLGAKVNENLAVPSTADV